MILLMGCATDTTTTTNSTTTKPKPANTVVKADRISKDSAPLTVTKTPTVTSGPTPNVEATVEALVQEKLEAALAEQATKLISPSDPAKMSELEVLTRFEQYLTDTVNDMTPESNKSGRQVVDTDCGSIYEPRQAGCDDYIWEFKRRDYLEQSKLVAIIRSRQEPVYQDKGTWVITIYPEDSDRTKSQMREGEREKYTGHPEFPGYYPLMEYLFFESGDLDPTPKN